VSTGDLGAYTVRACGRKDLQIVQLFSRAAPTRTDDLT
jgi:hypothetical protein